MNGVPAEITGAVRALFSALDDRLSAAPARLRAVEVGVVEAVRGGVANVAGLVHVGSGELVRFSSGAVGLAYDLDEHRVGVALLDGAGRVGAGDEVTRTGRVLDVPVGRALVGRVIEPTGAPLDGHGPLRTDRRLPIERPAPRILDRAPVERPLQTGVRVIDSLVPIGRGQRELIVGDRHTGKTSVALDTILNQRGAGVTCVYCAIGQQTSEVARIIAELESCGAMAWTTVVVAPGEAPAGVHFIAPYAAMSIGEEVMERGGDALVVFDSLTNHARATRELALLFERTPGREAFPGDIFYVHARLLERATQLSGSRGGGSLTALPIVETEAQQLAAYIPTNLISITDGQVVLSPELFDKGILPAVDIGASVSRVGGQTQLPAYRAVVRDLRLAYTQFEELESFARFGTRLDPDTERALEHGLRIRAVLRQRRGVPQPVAEQIGTLFAATDGLLDDTPPDGVAGVTTRVTDAIRGPLAHVAARIDAGELLSKDDLAALRTAARVEDE